MPRQPRIVIPNIPHHITQRGNYRQTIFEEQADYERYCVWAQAYAAKYNLSILAYCLMNNHVHLIVVPHAKDTLAKAINTLHMRYSQYMNKKNQVKGHLWQGRFFSSFLDEVYLYRAIRYVEQNPVRAGMVKEAWAYRWSSARVHAGVAGEESPIVIDRSNFAMDAADWKRFLKAKDKELCDEIRMKTGRGLAVGTEKFVTKIENKLQRSLECKPQGRPRKESK